MSFASGLVTDVSADWREARRQRRLRQRRLPHGLRDDVARVRRDDLADDILDLIFNEVRLEAAKDSGLVTIKGDVGDRQVVMPVVERQILRRLNADLVFRGRVRNEIAGALREAHLIKTNPSEVENVPTLSLADAPEPRNGLLVLRSSVGLGTATYLEGEPEEWALFVASRVVAPLLVDEEDETFDRPLVRIISIGSGSGGLARVVAGLTTVARIEVAEFDEVLPETTDLHCVVGTRNGVPFRAEQYDAAAMALAAPGVGGAANHRRLYRKTREPRFDLSALGPRKWIAEVAGRVGGLRDLLADDGRAFVLVPAGIRNATGYTSAPELLEAVLDAAEHVGLEVIEQLRVVEVEPVNQPCVGRARPERWSLTLQHRKSAEVADA